MNPYWKLLTPKICAEAYARYIPAQPLRQSTRIPDVEFISMAIKGCGYTYPSALEVGAWDTDAWKEIKRVVGPLTISDSFAWANRSYCAEHMFPRSTWEAEANRAGVPVKTIDIAQRIQVDSVDIIYSISVIEHVKEDARAITNIYNALKPGGWFILTTEVNLFQDMPYQDDVFFKVYKPEQVLSMLSAAGFDTLKLDTAIDDSFNTQMRAAVGKPELLRIPYNMFCSAGFAVRRPQ